MRAEEEEQEQEEEEEEDEAKLMLSVQTVMYGIVGAGCNFETT